MNELIDQMWSQRDALQRELENMLKPAQLQNRNLTKAEDERFAEIRDSIKDLDSVIDKRTEAEKRKTEAAEERRKLGLTGSAYVNDPSPYRRDDRSTSFFLDMRNAQRGDAAAIERLSINQAMAVSEQRAGDMTTVAGAGGEFAPPLWIVEDYVALARPGRVTADLCERNPLPPGVSSINLPKVASGTSVAVQATQNSAVSDTAMTTTSVSSGITTVAGKQIIALQLIEQSPIPFDQVVLKDLAAAHATQLGTQVLYGTNASGQLDGISGVSGINSVTYTTTSPVVASSTSADSFLYQVLKATGKIFTGIFRPPTAVVMHPRRWLWVLDALDTTNRPLVVPQGAQFNGPAVSDTPRAEGAVGVLAGLDVYVDPNVSTTANSSTNQDECYVLKADELYLWETSLKAESFDATYADQMSLLVRLYSYAAFIPHRRPTAISVIRGTGLVDPGLS